jgi:prephenate dehydratase
LFDNHQLEITDIKTRPIKEKLFEHVYFFEFHFERKKVEEVKKILEEIKAKVLKLKLLGMYCAIKK